MGIHLICAAMLSLLLAGQVSDRTPVIVELFTSEGCSSCPPADRLLSELLAQQPIAGVEIIALSEHVDYWNSLGWRDPFSAVQFTSRQNSYGETYTPQMVVDGITGFVGNDRAQAMQAIAEAGLQPKSSINVAVNGLKLHITVPAGESADVYLAIAENNLSSNVTRGENEGKTLSHVAVVRKLNVLGRVTKNSAFSREIVISLAREWKRDDLRAVVFIQSPKTRRILAASSVPLK